MTENVLYMAFWEDMNDSAYLYGSSLKHINNHYVEFDNRLMPAGVVIKEWKSFVDFQAERHEPRLPLLSPGEAVIFRAFYRDSPLGSAIFRVIFYDRRKQRIDSVVLKGAYDRFTLPKDAFSYAIQLVNGGTEKVSFGYMTLCSESHTVMHDIVRRDRHSDILHILVPKYGGRMIRLRDEEIPEGMTNVTAMLPHFFGTYRYPQLSEMVRLKLFSFREAVIHCADREYMKYTDVFSTLLNSDKRQVIHKTVRTEYWNQTHE